MSDIQHKTDEYKTYPENKTQPECPEKPNQPKRINQPVQTDPLPKHLLQNNIHYTLVGDYYFPTCTLPIPENAPVPGRFAAVYESYLQESHPSEYTRLLWSNQLNILLRSIQAQCMEQLDALIRQMAVSEGITEQLKSANQLDWLRRMNSIRSRAEEIILADITNK